MPVALQSILDALRADFEQQASEEQLREFTSSIEQLEGVHAFGLQVGDQAVDFDLPSAKGDRVQLSQLLKKGPVVLQFFGSLRNPYDNIHVRAFDRILHDIHALGASLIGISGEPLVDLACHADTLTIWFPLLHDEGREITQKYGALFRLADGSEVTVPATIVVGRDGTIFSVFRHADFTKRKDPVEVFEVLRGLMGVDEGGKGQQGGRVNALRDERLDLETTPDQVRG